MDKREFEELALKEYDGTLTQAEKAKLDRWMAERSDDCQEMVDQGDLSRLLAQMDTVEPPPDLMANVMSEVSRCSQPQRTNEISSLPSFASFIAWFQPRPGVTFSLGAVAAMLIMAAVTLVTGPFEQVSSPQATGSIFHQQPGFGIDDSQELAFDLGVTKGLVRAGLINGEFLIEVEAIGESEVSIEFEIDPENLKFKGLYQNSGSQSDFSRNNNRMRLVGHGVFGLQLLFETANKPIAPITVYIESIGQTWRKTITFNTPGVE